MGHARAQMDGQAVVDVGTHQAQLTIRTAPGGRYRFGDVEVRSGARTETPLTIDPNWVREQVQLAIGYDRQYAEALLDEAQRRVFAMGVFSTVRVSADGQPTPDGRIPVVVGSGGAPCARYGWGWAWESIRSARRRG